MARLKHIGTGRSVTLGAATVVGRSKASTVVIEHPKTSGRHAVLVFRDGAWAVRDLGSRNGTRVDGESVPPGGQAPVGLGAELTFGRDRWTLVDDTAPRAVARGDDGAVCVDVGGLLPLPDDDAPDVTIYTHERRWVAEQGGQLRSVRDGETVIAGGRRWRLELPPPTEGGETTSTAAPGGEIRHLEALSRLTLAVSRDEETVEVSLTFLGEAVPLPRRSFGYLLVVLARGRARDVDEPRGEQGWMYTEDVCRQMRIAPTRLNVEVYRCRRLLASLGVEGAAGIIERRAHTHQIRLGVRCAEVVPIT